MSDDVTTLRINLSADEEMRESIRRLETHYKTISTFIFWSTTDEHTSTATNTTTNTSTLSQQNFANFLTILSCQKSKQDSCFTREYQFHGLKFGLDEAKMIVKIVNKSESYRVRLKFFCYLPINVFQYIHSECGEKRFVRSKSRKLLQHKQKRLIICGTGVNFDHVKSLDDVLIPSMIVSLTLQEMQVDENGAVALSNMLRQNNVLTSLDLSDNHIGVIGARALADMLCSNTCLVTLNLSRNNIEDGGVIALAQSLLHNSTLHELYLSRTGCSSQSLFALANTLSHVSTSSLKELNLSHNGFGENTLEGMVALGDSLKINPVMTRLTLGGSSVSFCMGVAHILTDSLTNRATKFELRLTISYGIADEIAIAVAQCHSSMLILDLSFCNVWSDHIKSFAEGIQAETFDVQSLDLNFADDEDHCVKYLFDALVEKQDSCSLIELSFGYITGISQEGAKYITDNLPFTNLQRLYLTEIPIGNDGVQQIATYLNDTKLTELGLDGVGMVDSGLIALSNALRHNNKLTYLDICGNSGVTIFGKQALLETLKGYNMVLRDISLNKCGDFFTPLDDEIKYYVSLNQAKREKLHDPNLISPFGLFADILEDNRNDPSIIYWILQTCPHIFFNRRARIW